MISPELLRRYPFYAELSSRQLDQLAMCTELVRLEDGEVVFEEGQPAAHLYFLLQGSIDLYYTVIEAYKRLESKRVPVCSINPGEPFGISALIPPLVLTATAISTSASQVIRVDGAALNELAQKDSQLHILLLQKMSRAAMERLHATRVQLAAAYA